MAKVKFSVASRRRRKKILKAVAGQRGGRHRLYRTAIEAQMRALRHAYIGRRLRKRQMRRLWILRINAAARLCGLTYGQLMAGLKKADVVVDRKMLAELAVNDSPAFAKLAEAAKGLVAA